MSGMDFKLNGFRELESRLKNLADVEATKAGQSAVSSAATMLKGKVIERAPRSSVAEGTIVNRRRKGGAVRKEAHAKIVNHVKQKKVRAEAGKVTSAVYVDKKAYHASFVEYGSIHNAPNPFMKTAIDGSAIQLIEKMSSTLNKQLIKRGV